MSHQPSAVAPVITPVAVVVSQEEPESVPLPESRAVPAVSGMEEEEALTRSAVPPTQVLPQWEEHRSPQAIDRDRDRDRGHVWALVAAVTLVWGLRKDKNKVRA